jgi:hypothetical protein
MPTRLVFPFAGLPLGKSLQAVKHATRRGAIRTPQQRGGIGVVSVTISSRLDQEPPHGRRT